MSDRPRAPRAPVSERLLRATLEVQGRWADLVAPHPSGLPSPGVLLWFPLLVVVSAVVLVVLGISGSSTGNYWAYFGDGRDPDLLTGMPRMIRTDEWLVQSGWILSQARQGFPAVNETLPGGMDATIQNDLPSWDWSSAFRPHVLGFLLLPLDQGMAVRWWLPFVVLLVSAYAFTVTLLPRRPVSSALLASALGASPLLQWWFLPTTLWPVGWCLTVLVALLWAVRSRSRAARWGAAAVAGYLSVCLAMSIYVPFMVPAVLVAVVVGIGVALDHARRWGGLRGVTARVLPLLASGAAAVAVLATWIATRVPTIESVVGTVYPGARLEPTGQAGFGPVLALLSAPFQRAMQESVPVLAPNASEAASPLLLSVALLVPLCAVGARRWRRTRRVDALVASIVVAHLVLAAFLLVPGWDGLAHLLLLDRTTVARSRLALDLLNVVSVAVLAARLERGGLRRRLPWSVALLGAGVVAAGVAVVYVALRSTGSPVLVVDQAWKVVAVLLVLAPLALARGRVLLGTAAFLVASLVVGGGVNPLYRGVFDLADTVVGEEVRAVEEAEPDATWVGIGSFYATAVLVESGVTAYNGVQTYPPEEMWSEIDPDGDQEGVWNRLANVNWRSEPGSGDPSPSNPERDQILLSFDACSPFAQEHVDYVLAEGTLDDPCLDVVADARQGSSRMLVYEVD